jgi:feruloyl-CoA synthase
MGDAIDLADPDNPSAGFVFQGRIAEDFKLSTGTWVRVGPLRARLLAALGGLVHDVVITGHGREFVGALLFPHLPAWRTRAGMDADYPIGDLLRHEGVRRDLAERLRAFASEHRGSSTAPARVAILETPPQFDAREVTDKGSLNQRAVLEARAAIVEQLYGADGDALVIEIAERSTSV